MSGCTGRMGMRVLTLAMLVVARTAVAQPPAESGVARDARAGAPLACLHVMLIDTEDNAGLLHTLGIDLDTLAPGAWTAPDAAGPEAD